MRNGTTSVSEFRAEKTAIRKAAGSPYILHGLELVVNVAFIDGCHGGAQLRAAPPPFVARACASLPTTRRDRRNECQRDGHFIYDASSSSSRPITDYRMEALTYKHYTLT